MTSGACPRTDWLDFESLPCIEVATTLGVCGCCTTWPNPGEAAIWLAPENGGGAVHFDLKDWLHCQTSIGQQYGGKNHRMIAGG
jgi:hypothetical protein